jgi:hypothetical protein
MIVKRVARTLQASLLVAVSASSALGCSSADANDPTATAGQPFVAFADAFQNFHSWQSTPGVTASGVDGGVHITGPLVTYINHAPPSGSTSFPIGTVIVKEVNAGDLTTRQIFAMVKRGGDYNPSGAVNWEWFELQNIDESNVSILWRGFGPPSGESYGGNPNTCNGCHEGIASNDYVWTEGLTLSNF